MATLRVALPSDVHQTLRQGRFTKAFAGGHSSTDLKENRNCRVKAFV
jgi:hypothetical protein